MLERDVLVLITYFDDETDIFVEKFGYRRMIRQRYHPKKQIPLRFH